MSVFDQRGQTVGTQVNVEPGWTDLDRKVGRLHGLLEQLALEVRTPVQRGIWRDAMRHYQDCRYCLQPADTQAIAQTEQALAASHECIRYLKTLLGYQ